MCCPPGIGWRMARGWSIPTAGAYTGWRARRYSMREASAFGFRVWHKRARKMALVDALLFSIGDYMAHTSDGLSGSGHLSDGVLMQWTGLHDDHRQEIWEGDLLRLDSEPPQDRYWPW